MENQKTISIVLAIILLLTLINLYGTFKILNTYEKLLGKQVIGDENSGTTGNTESGAAGKISADDDPAKGSKDAPVTIIEFSDYQCPFCARFYQQTLPLIEENYITTGKVKFVYRDFPLGGHPNAQKAAEASECADEQGKFWEYHDIIFNNQQALDTASLKKYAAGLGLKTQQFNECLDSGKMRPEIQKDLSDGQKYGVSGTPAFFVNSISISGAQPYEIFQQAIEEELNK